MVIDSTWEMMTMNVISRPISVVVKFNTIVKIHKNKRFHEGHHFISMPMEVHNAPKHDMDCFIRECVHFFHDRKLKGHLSLFFCIQFLKQCVNIVFQCVLASDIERKIVLVGDVYCIPPITIKFHDLHVGDIRRVVGEITSYHKRD